jgi:MFS family permease
MDAALRREIRRVNTAGVLGMLYGLSLGELLLFFVTQCLKIPKEDWALVAAILPLTTAFHLVSAYLTEHFRRRKVLSLGCFAVARLAIPAITLLPFVTGEHQTRFRLYYLAAALIAHGSINALGASAWLSWVADIVPADHRGRFWAVRMALNTLIYCGAYLVASWFVNRLGQGNPWGYLGVFGFAFAAGEVDLLIHARVADRPMPKHAESVRLLPLLAAPWRHTGFRNLMMYRTLFVFGGFLTTPFAAMYLIEELGLTPWHMGVLMVTFLVVTGVSVFVWRVIGDRIGYRNVSLMADTLCGFGILYWWFIPYDNRAAAMLLLAAARVYFGFLNSGIALSQTTLTMNIAPEKHRSTYFDQVTIIVALAMSAGIFCGRWIFMSLAPVYGTMLFGTKLTAVHVLLGLYGLSRFAGVWLLLHRIPDVRAETALPRIRRILRTNPTRLFPILSPFERPIPAETRKRHLAYMRDLMPEQHRDRLEDAIRQVLRDDVHAEEEFYAFVGRERIERGRGVRRMVSETAELLALHHAPPRARAAARRLERLYAGDDLAGCLRTIRRLAHQTADSWDAPGAVSALAVIDALAETTEGDARTHHDAVLLTFYALLQILREPDPAPGRREPG